MKDDNSLIINYMSDGLFTCVNCQLQFYAEHEYKEHYKSEHHRYNVKRKLIALPPLSFNDYLLQFQTELSSKSQSQAEIYCQVCSKKFMSPQTYKQHINSQRHKLNRKGLLNKDKSETSSLSDFQVLPPAEQCPFCPAARTQQHMLTSHSFPPFRADCNNLEGLITCVEQIVNKGHCLFCGLEFGCAESARQHMADVGHARLDLDNFVPFEPYYLWRVEESSQEEVDEDQTQQVELLEESDFSLLHQNTLQSMEEKRLARIKLTPTGAVINGKQVGYRAYRQYYKQKLDRNIEPAPREHQKALPVSDQWNKSLVPKPVFQKIITNNNHR